jgi:hypothetical protein
MALAGFLGAAGLVPIPIRAGAKPAGAGEVCVYRTTETAEDEGPKRRVRILVYREDPRKIERDVTLALGQRACFAFAGQVVLTAYQPPGLVRRRAARDQNCRRETGLTYLREYERKVFEVWAERHPDGGVCWVFWDKRRGGK